MTTRARSDVVATETAANRQSAELCLEQWPVERLIPSPRNARTHSAAQVAEIAGSIRAFGFTSPILVGEQGDVIAGHGRLAAARLLGLTQVPVIALSGLTEVQRRQLMLADNRIALNAGWDLELLKLELKDLSAIGADLSALGFDAKELALALSGGVSTGLTDENDVPEPAEQAVTTAGDLWKLGPHRVICGDSTDRGTVATLLSGSVPGLMVTDPPYGVAYDPTWRHRMGVSQSDRTGKVRNDDRADWRAAWDLFPASIAYVWHGALHATTVAESLVASGFTVRSQIIWAKERLVIGCGDYHWQHEPCWYAVRKKGNWTGDRKQTTLWSIPSGGQDAETKHGTQKPVECMRRPMLNNSETGQAVYEPFLGSGTTLIAAQTTGRVCFAVELDPLYVDIAVRRWQAFTGEKAIRTKDGAMFDDLAEAWVPRPRPLRPRPSWTSTTRRDNQATRVDMRGRRPKPTRLKVLTGNPGKRRLNAGEPQPDVVIPDCPPELGPVARREWDRLAKELVVLRIMTNLDRAAVAAYCGAYALWAEATEAIQKYGTMVKAPSGFPVQSPYVSIANRQAELMMRIASEFGFTPASRSRISTSSIDEPSLFDEPERDSADKPN